MIVDESTGEILDETYPQSSTTSSTDLSTASSPEVVQVDAATSEETDEQLALRIIDEAESMLSDGFAPNGEGEDAGEEQIEPADNLLPIPGAQLGNLDPFRIVANTRQPRSEFDQEALDELTHSVREFGVFQPIVVRPIPDEDPRRSEGEYELIMGERRLRATKASGRTSIPAIIRHTDDEDMLRDALLENLHRADLNPLEEASAYQQLLEDFGCSQQELSERIGRSRPRISNTIRLLKLPVDVQRKVAAGVLSAGHARAILSVGEPAAMTQLANKIINENLTVRESEMAAATMSIRTDRPPTKQAQVGTDSLNAHLSTVGERLGDRLNTRVKVVLRKTKGQISIDFASVADLNRILEAIGEPTDY
ncbi:ParB/RepB/Spo0J family partition protein [Gulosibacter chungangensis]